MNAMLHTIIIRMDFIMASGFRHAFDNTVENVSVVKIITGNAEAVI